LVEKKGHEYSIRAIANLLREGFPIHYTIVGEGPLRKKLEDDVLTLGISENVTFAGELTQEQVIEHYNNAHLFVLSSVTASDGDKEGQGLVIQEARPAGFRLFPHFTMGFPKD